MKEKRAAIELSIGTIVIIVLAMSMLILGLVLVSNIFDGSTDNIDALNDGVKGKIQDLLDVGDKKVAVYLSNQIAPIEQGEEWGVAFGIKNLNRGATGAETFTYQVKVADPDVRQKCQIGERDVESWIRAGKAGSAAIAPGDSYYGIVRVLIPESAPLCIVRFNLEVKLDGATYATDFFDIDVLA